MRVQVVDPSAYTPPYDHALCSALARAGAEVELVTGDFLYGSEAPDPEGYRRTDLFYRHGSKRAGSRRRFAAKLLQHPFDMHRLARGRGLAIPKPDVRHFQWLTVQPYDARVLRRLDGPTVLTAHDVMPREPRPGQLRGQRRLYDAVDAVVVHSEHGRRRLSAELGVPEDKVHVIPHGAFEHLTRLPREKPLAPDLERRLHGGPAVLFFGLIRPYKGVDVLLRAWRGVRDPAAQLLVAGLARVPLGPLERLADARVSFLPRFFGEPEVPALFRRADVVVLPYREIDQSGVLATALAFGKACIVSDVGGFSELAEHGAVRLVPPGDEDALATAIEEVLSSPQARERLERSARALAAGPHSWDAVAARTLELYRALAD